MPICKACGEDKKHHAHGLCRRCYNAKHRSNHKEYYKEYLIANRDKSSKYNRRYRRAHGGKSASENKKCSMFLGVHVAERVLSNVFKDVKQMPYGCSGYDFICNKGKKIGVKGACTYTDKCGYSRWHFRIRRNKTADYFLCLAFDNRKDLNPLYIWLIPGHIVNHIITTSISKSTIEKWDEYKLDINKVVTCCDTMKQRGEQ